MHKFIDFAILVDRDSASWIICRKGSIEIKNPSLISELGFNRVTMAEGEGFEPSIRKNRITDFESVAFDLSAILPHEVELSIIEKLKNIVCFFFDQLQYLN